MKVIELLNKMALDKNYKPERIIYEDIEYEYEKPCYYFYDYYGNRSVGLFRDYQVERILNDEVEIIEITEK